MVRAGITNDMPEWKQFELAVAQFIKAIGGDANVTHDAHVPDAHTGYPRQRDIWVEWSLGGHFPAKALISCKYWKTPLNEQDIDHFNGEFISSRAQVGIIYSREGFNRPAILKAKALGFHCCKLYRNEAPELPEILNLGLAFHFRPQFRLQISATAKSLGLKYWKDVFAIRVGENLVIDLLAKEFDNFQHCNKLEAQWEMAKKGYKSVVSINVNSAVPLEVGIECRYKPYQAKIEYTMIEGSYNVTASKFLGSEASPWIDMHNTHPGPGWNEIEKIPDTIPSRVIASYVKSNSLSELRHVGEIPLPDLKV